MENREDEYGLSAAHVEFRTRVAAYKYHSPSPRRPRTARSAVLPQASQAVSSNSDGRYQARSSRKGKRSADAADIDDELPVLGVSPRKRTRKDITTIERSSSSTPSTPRKKVKKPKRGYAPPETYEHLHMLQDYLDQYLDVMFCGINPGCSSAEIGHHYAHSTNHFWECLYLSGLTDRLLSAEEDYTLPQDYNYGLTNLVDRPSAEQSELSHDEMRAAVPDLMSKILKCRPRIVCFLAKSIWEIFIKEVFRLSQEYTSPPASASSSPPPGPSNKGTPKMVKSRFFPQTEASDEGVREPVSRGATIGKKRQRVRMPKYTFSWELQPFKVVHRQLYHAPLLVKETLFFVVPSPSARVVHYQWWHKVEKFKLLKACVHDVKTAKTDTASMHIIPSEHIASKSVYWLVPKNI